MTEDEYRQRARRLVAAHQPANQVAYLLMEDGASAAVATQLAYSAKIRAFQDRIGLSLPAAMLGAVAFVVAMLIRPYAFGWLVFLLLLPSLAGLLDTLYCWRQIRMAKAHLLSRQPEG